MRRQESFLTEIVVGVRPRAMLSLTKCEVLSLAKGEVLTQEGCTNKIKKHVIARRNPDLSGRRRGNPSLRIGTPNR